jgi:hypothetical protein
VFNYLLPFIFLVFSGLGVWGLFRKPRSRRSHDTGRDEIRDVIDRYDRATAQRSRFLGPWNR